MARYTPGIAPAQYSIDWIRNELNSIAQAMETPNSLLNLDMQYAPPKKFREGAIVLADGTKWNPGSGKGAYCYYGGAWHFLG